jgi:hypothetical protein
MANRKIKSDLRVEQKLLLPAETAQRALKIDSTGEVVSSTVTETELEYLSGVTSSVQTQLNDKASTTDLNNHINDATDAHDASSISVIEQNDVNGTNVQAALENTMADLLTHVDSNVAHGTASDIVGISDTQTLTNKTIDADLNTISNIDNNDIKAAAGIVESKLSLDYSTSSLNTAISDHIADTSDAHDASAISNAPSGNLAATNVQGALDELQSDVDTRALDSDVIKKDGSVAYIGDQSMGGNKITNLGAPTSNGHALRYDELGVANGIATLDGSGKVPVSQLPSAVMTYEGVWNASTNSPTLADGSGDAGMVYRVGTAGSQDLGSGSISFAVGDYVIYNGTIWEKSDTTDAVASVFGRTGIVTAQSGDYTASQITNTPAGNISATTVQAAIDELDSEKFASADFNSSFDTRLATKSTSDLAEGSALYFTDERAQDAVGNNLLDTASVNLTYNDGTGQISADVLPAGVDHDSLQNFVANEHIDHSSVSINTNANSGLAGGGDITASRSLSVDITNATAETSADDADLILIHDDSANALRKMTRANFLAGISAGSAGDIQETSATLNDNTGSATNVTGFAFANATVRSFEALVSIVRGSTYETFKLQGIQKSASWDMSVEAVGDDTGVTFTINASGQVQYTTTNTGANATCKFRAITTTV